MAKILVTGSTGNIGRYVVSELEKYDKEVRAGVFHLDEGCERFKDSSCQVVKFDFLDSSTFEKALDDVEAIFLMRPPKLADPKKDMLPFLTAAKAKGVKKIVFVSLLGVEKNPIVPHRKIEDMVRELGIPYVFLRPSFFMQNLNTNHLDEIRDRDELFIPVGKSKTSFIDTRDIACVGARVLTDSTIQNQSFTLTGDKAIDYYEIANTMTEVLGRKITYKNPSLIQFRADRIKRGTPKEFANIMTVLYLMTKMGTAKDVTEDLEKLLGRKPINFKQYVIDHQLIWKK
ncbi:MAG: SDR family oxidoreductase [Turicibacter sp.]